MARRHKAQIVFGFNEAQQRIARVQHSLGDIVDYTEAALLAVIVAAGGTAAQLKTIYNALHSDAELKIRTAATNKATALTTPDPADP